MDQQPCRVRRPVTEPRWHRINPPVSQGLLDTLATELVGRPGRGNARRASLYWDLNRARATMHGNTLFSESLPPPMLGQIPHTQYSGFKKKQEKTPVAKYSFNLINICSLLPPSILSRQTKLAALGLHGLPTQQ